METERGNPPAREIQDGLAGNFRSLPLAQDTLFS